MKRFILIAVIIVIIGAVFSGCSSTSKQLEGSWYEEHGYLRLDIDEKCGVTYYQSEESSVDQEFEYEVLEDAFVLVNDDGKEISLKLVFAEDKKTIEYMEYIAENEKIVFTKETAEPASINEDLLLAMTEAKLKYNEYMEKGENTKALEALLSFSDEKILYNTINVFMDELNDFD